MRERVPEPKCCGKGRWLCDGGIRMDPKPGGILPVFVGDGKSASGAEIRKVYPAVCRYGTDPSGGGFDLEEVLARSYENLVLRWEAGELQDDLGAEEQEYLGRVLSEYEEAVSQDIQELARSCGLDLSECSVHIENNENSPQFGTVQSIFAVLPQQSGETEKEKLSNKIQEYYGLEERYVEIEIAGGEGPVDFSSDGGGDPVYSGIPGGK